MAISDSHQLGSCKAVPMPMPMPVPVAGRCNNRNRPLTLASAHASLLLLLIMLTSCLALPLESTTLSAADIVEATTINPPQLASIEVTSSAPTLSTANETIIKIEPVETAAAEVADELVHTSFVSLGGGGLEQDIRNAVKSEVESEVEPDFSALVERIQQSENTENEKINLNRQAEQTVAAQNVREPKTLETAQSETKGEERDSEGTKPEIDTVNTSLDNKQVVEIQNKPLPTVTSDLVAVIFDENRAITEQPITKANLLALEREHEEQQVVETTPKPTYEVTQHQVTKKQGVQDLLPIDLAQEETDKQEAPESVPEVEVVKTTELEAVQGPMPEIPEKEPVPMPETEIVAISEPKVVPAQEPEVVQESQPEIVQESQPEVVQESQPEVVQESEPEVVPTSESVVVQAPKEEVVQVQESEIVQNTVPEVMQSPELQATENNREQRKLDDEEKSASEPPLHLNEIEANIIESEDKDKQIQPVAPSTTEQDLAEVTEAYLNVVAPVEVADVETSEPVVETNEPVLNASSGTADLALAPTEANQEQSAVADVKSVQEDLIASADVTKTSESVLIVESSSTASPVDTEIVKVDESAEDVSENENSKSENRAESNVDTSSSSESSEESEDLSADEPRLKKDDSTATPLVSYPPHNSGQTFVSNLADERTAHLSLASTSRSTLIIALCSGTAVIFIVFSLVIFLLSFQRQHGTLDIEMQEQRLGKDNLDEEDAQMKLLDVELSPPVIVSMGNDETDECL